MYRTGLLSAASIVMAILAGSAISLKAVRLAEAGQESQKLITGFEKDELLRTDWVSREQKRGKGWFYLLDRPQGFDFAARFEAPTQTNRAWTWACRPGEHTEGEMALVASVRPANVSQLPQSYRPTDFLSFFYPSLGRVAQPNFGRQGQREETHWLMSTYQWFAKGRPDLKDWRGFDLLRIDARGDGSPIELRLALEDEVIEPPVMTTYSLPQGRWMTIELDLDAAVAARQLDLSRIANFWLMGTSQQRATVRFDNVRLAKRGTPAEREVLRDRRSLVVTYDKPSKPQVPARGDLPMPNRSPLALGKPIVVSKGTHTMFGWVAAWDNDHLFVALADGFVGATPASGPRGDCRAFQSLDGGKTWSEIGRPKNVCLDHQSTRGQAVDDQGDGASVAATPGCAGIGKVTPRYHFTKYTFTKNGWEARFPDILDADMRHCGWNAAVTRVLRGPYQGRLWASWGLTDRNHAVTVHVKYSDDDGQTWIPWGRGAELPGSSRGWLDDTYMFPVTAVTPYGDHVAVFWQHRGSKEVLWSRYDGQRWSAPELVPHLPTRLRGAYQTMSLITVGREEMFFTVTGLGAVLRWDGSRWHREPVSVDDCTLSLAGQTIAAFSAGKADSSRIFNNPSKRKAAISCQWRSPSGRWEDPLKLVPEFSIEELRSMPGFSVPRYSPPNFVPLAWSDADEGVVKMLRVPVPKWDP